MKLKLMSYVLFSAVCLMLVGCSNVKDSISEADAKQLVLNEHTNNNGKPSIVSVKIKNNAYYIKWKNEGNKEFGTDKVTDKKEVKMVEASIE